MSTHVDPVFVLSRLKIRRGCDMVSTQAEAHHEVTKRLFHSALSPSEAQSLAKRGYFLEEKIGEGSFSTVWKARYADFGGQDQPQTQPQTQTLACKLIDRTRLSEEAQGFSEREVEIVARICHPYIITHHSIIQREHKIFIFMRYAENGDVDSFLRKKGYLPENHARTWVRQVALALEYLHIRGVAHRDLKCSNLLITDKFNLKVTDFGFSRLSVDRFGKRILSETWCGSPAYTAPEVITGSPYDPFLADCWSLGVIMYAMLTASLPFDGNLPLHKILKSQMDQNWSIHPDIEKNLTAEIMRVLQRLLQPELKYRMTVHGLLSSEWIRMEKIKLPPGHPGRAHLPPLTEV